MNAFIVPNIICFDTVALKRALFTCDDVYKSQSKSVKLTNELYNQTFTQFSFAFANNKIEYLQAVKLGSDK